MKAIRVAAGVAALVAASAASAVAMPAHAASGGKVSIFVSGSNSSHQKVLLAGAIGDWGTGISVDANGKPDPNGSFEKLKLHKGSLLVDATKFNAAGEKPRPVLQSQASCSGAFAWSGPATIVSGTGAYKGATGRFKMSGIFAGVSRRTNGRCDFAGNTQPLAFYLSITGSGRINLG